ncbi:MAG: hypothetical protein BGO41_01675 [Clostridiales bacterium 38-18]|nr:MAG: hypothetical protein BGO41_01675 [Clostridiales bacterium 38-18]
MKSKHKIIIGALILIFLILLSFLLLLLPDRTSDVIHAADERETVKALPIQSDQDIQLSKQKLNLEETIQRYIQSMQSGYADPRLFNNYNLGQNPEVEASNGNVMERSPDEIIVKQKKYVESLFGIDAWYNCTYRYEKSVRTVYSQWFYKMTDTALTEEEAMHILDYYWQSVSDQENIDIEVLMRGIHSDDPSVEELRSVALQEKYEPLIPIEYRNFPESYLYDVYFTFYGATAAVSGENTFKIGIAEKNGNYWLQSGLYWEASSQDQPGHNTYNDDSFQEDENYINKKRTFYENEEGYLFEDLTGALSIQEVYQTMLENMLDSFKTQKEDWSFRIVDYKNLEIYYGELDLSSGYFAYDPDDKNDYWPATASVDIKFEGIISPLGPPLDQDTYYTFPLGNWILTRDNHHYQMLSELLYWKIQNINHNYK